MNKFLKNEIDNIDRQEIITIKYLKEFDKRKKKLSEEEKRIVEIKVIEYIVENKEFYGDVLMDLSNRKINL